MTSADRGSVVKLTIAQELFDQALELYVQRRNFFCIIHLAAAAADIFDQHLSPGQKKLFEIARDAEVALSSTEGRPKTRKEAADFVNRSKNAIKHAANGSPDFDADPFTEAWWWTNQAYVAFIRMRLPKTKAVFAYEEYERTAPPLHSVTPLES